MKVPYQDLPSTARVWIYQNSKEIDPDQQAKISESLDLFVSQWSAHNQPLSAHGEIRHDRFIILVVDEGQNMASGCSIDASVHFIRQVEEVHQLDLFDRMVFSFQKNESVSTVKKSEFSRLYAAGVINDETWVFDNLIKTKEELDTTWLKPLGQSWHKRFAGSLVS